MRIVNHLRSDNCSVCVSYKVGLHLDEPALQQKQSQKDHDLMNCSMPGHSLGQSSAFLICDEVLKSTVSFYLSCSDDFG